MSADIIRRAADHFLEMGEPSIAGRLQAVAEQHDGLLAELRQCATELEEAANLLRRSLPRTASLYDAARDRARARLAAATAQS